MSAQPIGEYERIVSRREAVMARLSPTAQHAHFPNIYARPIPRDAFTELRQENVALRAEKVRLEEEVTRLNEELAEMRNPKRGARAIMMAFCRALEAVGHKVDGTNYTIDDLCSQRRAEPYVRPRHVAVWLCRRLCRDMSMPKISAHFGNRDHTTVINAMRRAAPILEKDSVLRAAADLVLAQFEGRAP